MNTSTPSQNSQNPFVRKLAIVLVAIAVLLWAAIFAFSDKTPEIPSPTAKKTLNIGDIGIIRIGLPAGLNKDAYDEIQTFAAAKDTDGLNGLLQSGKAVFVDNNSQVKVIELGFAKKRVRLLSGDHKGAAVWVPNEFVESEQ
ncbi:hypothetical protein [Spirosoma areae]